MYRNSQIFYPRTKQSRPVLVVSLIKYEYIEQIDMIIKQGKLLKEHSDQGLHCLPLNHHTLESLNSVI